MKAKFGILLSTIIVAFFSIGTNVFAESTGVPFEIKPKFTADQEKDVANYISIKVDGNSKKETFEFTIKNRAKESKEVVIKVVDAYTSPNGIIQYTDSETENSTIVDDKYKMSSHLTLQGDSVITLKGGEERVIKTDFNAENLEGTLLGGVSFQLYEEGKPTGQEDSSFKINNKINMVVGVIVDFDNGKDVNILVDQPYVDPMPSYYAVRLPITMDAPLFKKVTMKYEVSKNGSTLFDGKSDYEFAPKSKVKVSLPWATDSIKNNEKYKITGTLTYKDKNENEKTQPFEFDFAYTTNDNVIGNITNALTRPFEENSSATWIFVVAGAGIIALIIFLVKRKKNRKENDEEHEEE